MTADIRLVQRRVALKMLGVAPVTQVQADGARWVHLLVPSQRRRTEGARL